MSLASWKREFYRTPANKVSKRYALQHSFKKWVGLLLKNRIKHKVSLRDGILYNQDNQTGCNGLIIDSGSCALCRYYYTEEWKDDDDRGKCFECPLQSCNDAYLLMMDHNRVMPMVNLLKRAIKRKKK